MFGIISCLVTNLINQLSKFPVVVNTPIISALIHAAVSEERAHSECVNTSLFPLWLIFLSQHVVQHCDCFPFYEVSIFCLAWKTVLKF